MLHRLLDEFITFSVPLHLLRDRVSMEVLRHVLERLDADAACRRKGGKLLGVEKIRFSRFHCGDADQSFMFLLWKISDFRGKYQRSTKPSANTTKPSATLQFQEKL
jgi:hypothetical protein